MWVHMYQHRAILVLVHGDAEGVENVIEGKDVGHIIPIIENSEQK